MQRVVLSISGYAIELKPDDEAFSETFDAGSMPSTLFGSEIRCMPSPDTNHKVENGKQYMLITVDVPGL